MNFEDDDIFISEEDFVKEISRSGLHSLKVDVCDDINIFLTMSFDAFLSFAKEKTLDVFYYISYLDESDFIISRSTFNSPKILFQSSISDFHLSSNFLEHIDELLFPDDYADSPTEDTSKAFNAFESALVSEILEYNHSIDHSYFTYPESAQLFVLYEGHSIGIEIELFDCPYSTAECELQNIFLSHKDVLAQHQASMITEKENLRDFLFHDIDFTRCTNKALRKEYMQRMWNDPAHSNVRVLFHDPFNDFAPDKPSTSFKSFIELVYSEYRNQIR